MRKFLISVAMIAQVLGGFSAQVLAKDSFIEFKNDDGSHKLNVGGLLRFNHRYENWEGSPNKGFGKFDIDIFRVDIKAKYDDAFFTGSYVIQDQEKTSIEKAYFGYNFDKQNTLEFGLVYKPFALYPYPQNGWTYHLPFFLGYGNNIAPGLNWNYVNQDWDLRAGYYPEMLATNLRFSPESATYDDLSNNAFAFQKGYQNEKKNQVNARIARKFTTEHGKQEFGFSGAIAQLENKITNDDGHYYAVGLHSNNNYKRWNLQSSVIHYEYDAKNPEGVDKDVTLMGANGLTPAYFIASEGTVASLNLAYTLPIQNMGRVKSISFYNDYSYLDKKRSDWSNSQMNTTGVRLLAPPFMVWTDYSWGKNANIIGGASNGTGFSSTNSINSDKWLYRVNVNLGVTF